MELVSIEYAGEQEVWDIETEKYHTFFANGIAVHNCQQFDPDLEPEVTMTQTASRIPSKFYAGTSLTVDTMLETKWLESSMGTWHIFCPCGQEIDCGDQKQAIEVIKDKGPTCPRCSRILDVGRGHYVHKDEAMLRAGQVGLHIPQIIIPDLVRDRTEWAKITYALKHFELKKVLQEFLGIPTEEGARELTLEDIKGICVLPESMEYLRKRAREGYYRFVLSACDWGGSDYNMSLKTKISTTVHVMMGLTQDFNLDIIHCRRYHGMGYREVAHQIVTDHVANGGGPIATDFGVGAAYNMLLREDDRINKDRHFILGYVGPKSQIFAPPPDGGLYNQYSVNKTETLTSLYEAIKRTRMVNGVWRRDPRIRASSNWEEMSPFLMDFLNVYRIPTEMPGGTTTFRYQRHGSKPDDTLQAVNFGYIIARVLSNEPIVEDPSLREKLMGLLSGQTGSMVDISGLRYWAG